MIQDIAPHQFHNEFEPREPHSNDFLLSYHGNNVLLKPDHTFFHYDEVSSSRSFTYLFRIDDTAFYLTDLTDQNTISMPFRFARSYEPKFLGFACITGWQLYRWYQENQYCGTDGTKMIRDEKERAMRCPTCGQLIYPRINPAVIVAVINDHNQILVTKYAHGPYQKYALIAGYAEIGETIEQTVIRETFEETGLHVSDLKYFKSQPWSFSSTLLFGYTCRVHGDCRLTLQKEELRLGEWKDRNEEIDSMDNASLTSEMIRMFKEGKFD
ncbi:MAG: NAD(+) diphosphatase [Erysipelotrichia bacterium]|nr:NAD(+) diphosphatase [Erysipelotrichia bacterium]